jgi:hypothetical protein
MLQRIEYAARQALDARQRANECTDVRAREEWMKVATMWDGLVTQYQAIMKITGETILRDHP